MTQLSLDIIPTTKRETAKRKQLLSVIGKKRTQLQYLVIKTEMLRVNLEMAKQEYMVKVGSLFLKDNHLDLEIIRLQNVLRLMQDGLSYDEAVNQIAQTYYAQQLEIEKEQEHVRVEEQIFKKREEHKGGVIGDVKKIWKQLIARFHPDLVQDSEEKKKRDTIMKQVNRAYQEGDYDQLVKIQQEHLADKETSITNLEDILVTVMKEIIQQNELYKELRASEWYDWMIKIEKAKKKSINIFADTERTLLNDIVAKYEILNKLKSQLEVREKHSV